jgi:Na+/alanine symporter
MASSYLLMGLIVVLLHLDQVPAALGTIVDAAFSGAAAAGRLCRGDDLGRRALRRGARRFL